MGVTVCDHNIQLANATNLVVGRRYIVGCPVMLNFRVITATDRSIQLAAGNVILGPIADERNADSACDDTLDLSRMTRVTGRQFEKDGLYLLAPKGEVSVYSSFQCAGHYVNSCNDYFGPINLVRANGDAVKFAEKPKLLMVRRLVFDMSSIPSASNGETSWATRDRNNAVRIVSGPYFGQVWSENSYEIVREDD